MHWYHLIQHWLAYRTGSLNMPGSPPNYNFFSGSGSDLTEVTMIGAMLAVFKKHNCHARWCVRVGHHELEDKKTGLKYNLCRRHHPEHPGRRALTANHFIGIHKRNHDGH